MKLANYILLLFIFLVLLSCKKKPEAAFILKSDSTGTYNSVDLINTSLRSYNYLWDFGNGETVDAENPSFFYTEPGNYTIKLTAFSDNGKRSDEAYENILVTRSNTVIFDDFHFSLDEGAYYNYGDWNGTQENYNFDLYLVGKFIDLSLNNITGTGHFLYFQFWTADSPVYGEYSFSNTQENKSFSAAVFGVDCNFYTGIGYIIEFSEGDIKIEKDGNFDIININLFSQEGYKLEAYYRGSLQNFNHTGSKLLNPITLFNRNFR